MGVMPVFFCVVIYLTLAPISISHITYMGERETCARACRQIEAICLGRLKPVASNGVWISISRYYTKIYIHSNYMRCVLTLSSSFVVVLLSPYSAFISKIVLCMCVQPYVWCTTHFVLYAWPSIKVHFPSNFFCGATLMGSSHTSTHSRRNTDFRLAQIVRQLCGHRFLVRILCAATRTRAQSIIKLLTHCPQSSLLCRTPLTNICHSSGQILYIYIPINSFDRVTPQIFGAFRGYLMG